MTVFVAQPWWVNLIALIPPATFLFWRRGRNPLTSNQLLLGAIFAMAFGFLEAAVVVYLRAAIGLLPEAGVKLAYAVGPPAVPYQQMNLLNGLTNRLLHIEVMREATTMVMLASVALLASARARGRWAMFLWTFAVWDITYYAGLWVLVRWPASLRETDVLFLIPVPWLAPVWFPVIVSGLMIVVLLVTKQSSQTPAA